MHVDEDKVSKTLNFLISISGEEDRFEKKHLEDFLDEELGNTLVYLRDREVIETHIYETNEGPKTVISVSDNVEGKITPKVLEDPNNFDYPSETGWNAVEESLVPESKVLGALAVYGDAYSQGLKFPEYSDSKLESILGEEYDQALELLKDLDYLKLVESRNKLGDIERVYRLEEDPDVRLDVSHISDYVDTHYDGDINDFEEQYAMVDRDNLEGIGVKLLEEN